MKYSKPFPQDDGRTKDAEVILKEHVELSLDCSNV